MKLVSFSVEGETRPGVLDHDDTVIDLAAAAESLLGVSPPVDVMALLDADVQYHDVVTEVVRAVRELDDGMAGGLTHSLQAVRLKAPLTFPRKLLCLAGNYEAHIREGGRAVTDKDRVTPRVFMKPPTTTIIDPETPIPLAAHTHFIDWEGELGVVIGRVARRVAVESALQYVAGYTIVNDVSEREFCIRERAESNEWDRFFDWLNGKWLDGFAPMGPCIALPDEIPDPQQLTIETRVNGEVKQLGSTADMIFSVAEIVSYVSTFVTLEPGDVISTGTPAGVGKAAGQALRPGDQVSISIPPIGILRNTVASAD